MEVITGVGRRRKYTDAFKAQIVEETLVPGAVVSQVARRHGLTPQQVFTWRREMRQPPTSPGEAPTFAPVLIEARPDVSHVAPGADVGTIELTIRGACLRIPPGAEVRMVATVLRALKARS
ncbi:MAG: transposase [Alphaproteobacteria bacterium]|nr:transposase [Alphaproteobacteria bacterium]